MKENSKENLRQDKLPATAASLFTDDLILEVLSRLPARSVRCFMCVSKPWRDLIADPVHHKKLPQILAGFIYTTYDPPRVAFASVSGSAAPVDPSLPFLQPKYKYITPVDTCNGLLLCFCLSKETPAGDKGKSCYVVCNPASERWIELPPKPQAWATGFNSGKRLGFDPKVSSHFHVLEFPETTIGMGSYVTGVDIFSSQTGAWIHRDGGLVEKITFFLGSKTESVFFGGMLHLVGKRNPINIDKEYAMVVVDMEGKVWKTIRLPDGSSNATIGLSQGCLHYASITLARVNNSNKMKDDLATEITLWCLENYGSKEWVLKHSAIIDEPLGIAWELGRLFSIHPDRDTVFWVPVGGDMLASWDMQHHKFVHIPILEKNNNRKFLPYVPLFSEALADAGRQ